MAFHADLSPRAPAFHHPFSGLRSRSACFRTPRSLPAFVLELDLRSVSRTASIPIPYQFSGWVLGRFTAIAAVYLGHDAAESIARAEGTRSARTKHANLVRAERPARRLAMVSGAVFPASSLV
jgi:hypothetical protein